MDHPPVVDEGEAVRELAAEEPHQLFLKDQDLTLFRVEDIVPCADSIAPVVLHGSLCACRKRHTSFVPNHELPPRQSFVDQVDGVVRQAVDDLLEAHDVWMLKLREDADLLFNALPKRHLNGSICIIMCDHAML